MVPQQFIFALEDLSEPGGKAFQVDTPAGVKNGFVIRYAGRVRAYINSCPHTGVSLNWSDEQFFDYAQEFVQCSMHGALFEPLTGLCVWGPCQGEKLHSLELELVDQHVIIYI